MTCGFNNLTVMSPLAVCNVLQGISVMYMHLFLFIYLVVMTDVENGSIITY